MLLRHGTQLSYSSGNDFVKRNVFNCFLNEKRKRLYTEKLGTLCPAWSSVISKIRSFCLLAAYTQQQKTRYVDLGDTIETE